MRSLFKSLTPCLLKRLRFSIPWKIGQKRTSWYFWSLLRPIGSHKIFYQTLLQRDFMTKWRNWESGPRRSLMTTLFAWSEIWSPRRPSLHTRRCWIPSMVSEMKLVLAFPHGLFGLGLGLLKRIGMETFSTSTYTWLGELTWDKLKKRFSIWLAPEWWCSLLPDYSLFLQIILRVLVVHILFGFS